MRVPHDEEKYVCGYEHMFGNQPRQEDKYELFFACATVLSDWMISAAEKDVQTSVAPPTHGPECAPEFHKSARSRGSGTHSERRRT